LKTEAGPIVFEEKFFGQLEEFCKLVKLEFQARFNEIKEISNSASSALGFAEILILCPTQEAAKVCISRDLPAALSFVLAIQGLQRHLEAQTYALPNQAPEYQTHYYLLASTLQEYLEWLRLQPA
jgi:hypothetical protein